MEQTKATPSSTQIFTVDGVPLAPKAVQAQLAKILTSADFQSSRRSTDFLRFVVEETLAGRAAQLKEYTIAVKAMERDVKFDPQLDPAVRIQAGRLRQALAQYFHNQGATDPLRIDIPKGSYIPVFQLNENAVTPDIPASPRMPSAASDKRQTLTIGPAIAVVTFTNLSRNDRKEYFSVGLTEALMAELSRFPGIRIIGPLSPEKIKSESLDSVQIGKRYHVQFILSGSTRWHGDSIRIVANLVDSTSGEMLWSQSFDGNLDGNSMFDIEDDIIRRINGVIADYRGIIHRSSIGTVRPKTENFCVYDAMLRYHGFLDRLEKEKFESTTEALKEALNLEPENPLLLAMLADMYALDYMYEVGMLDDRLKNAVQLARRAISLDPGSQHARAVLAEVYFLRGQGESCRAEMEQLLALNPNHPSYLYVCGIGFALIGEWERGVALVHEAMRLNPHYSSYYHFILFLDQYRQGNYEAALIEARRIDVPGSVWGPLSRAVTLGQLDRFTEAQSELAEVYRIVPEFESQKQEMIRRQVFSEENAEVLLTGLTKANLGL